MSIFFLQFLLGAVFLTTIFLHLTKKELGAVVAYSLQSLIIVIILLNSFFETNNIPLLLVILATLVVKVILAPIFFIKLIKQYKLTFSVSTYLNTPLTLVVLATLTAVAHSANFAALTNIVPAHYALLSLALAAIFISLFLIVNRKGAISQALGVISIENSILAFAVFAGLEQSPLLQIGIIFDILIWLVIATVFIAMIYRHFGGLDTSLMQNLKD